MTLLKQCMSDAVVRVYLEKPVNVFVVTVTVESQSNPNYSRQAYWEMFPTEDEANQAYQTQKQLFGIDATHDH